MAGLPDFPGSFSRSPAAPPGRSLRARVLAAIILALALSAAVSGGASLLHARHSVAIELNTALRGADQAAREALARAAPAEPAALTALFAHYRHVQAVVLDPQGKIVAASSIDRGALRVPVWFLRILDPRLAPVRLATPDGAVLELRPDAANEIGEVWIQFQDALLFLLVFAALAFTLVSLTITRVLRPLEHLSRAFVRLGEGGYDVRLGLSSSLEVRQVEQGFNAMVGRLAEAQDRNARLEAQLLELQDEERADIAHDLHDQIGPYLFGASMDAETIVRLAGDKPAVVEPAKAIGASIEHIQHQVRDLLRRLKPTQAVELGLEPALKELVSFWSARRPDIAFRLDLGSGDAVLTRPEREALYRVAQEAVSNAVRHGAPERIEIVMGATETGEIVLSVEDDGGAVGAVSPSGFGLAGMRQRMAAVQGAVAAGPRAGGTGWLVRAHAPAALRAAS